MKRLTVLAICLITSLGLPLAATAASLNFTEQTAAYANIWYLTNGQLVAQKDEPTTPGGYTSHPENKHHSQANATMTFTATNHTWAAGALGLVSQSAISATAWTLAPNLESSGYDTSASSFAALDSMIFSGAQALELSFNYKLETMLNNINSLKVVLRSSTSGETYESFLKNEQTAETIFYLDSSIKDGSFLQTIQLKEGYGYLLSLVAYSNEWSRPNQQYATMASLDNLKAELSGDHITQIPNTPQPSSVPLPGAAWLLGSGLLGLLGFKRQTKS